MCVGCKCELGTRIQTRVSGSITNPRERACDTRSWKKMQSEYWADDSAWRIMTLEREEGFQGRTINRRWGRNKEEEKEEKSVGVREGMTKDLGRRRAVMGDKWRGEHRHEDEETPRAREPRGGRYEVIPEDLVDVMLLMRSLDVAYGGTPSPTAPSPQLAHRIWRFRILL